MVSTRRRSKGRPKPHAEEGNGNGKSGQYEESRLQRIKENEERLKSLGILDLSKKLKRGPSSSSSSSKPHRRDKPLLPPAPSRRSSRLVNAPRINYSDKKSPKKESSLLKNVKINIPEGEKPEIYTEEHEKLLGDSKAVWVVHVDGVDDDGQRIYDSVEGKTCHQCRQKTLGHHTECSKCKIVTGQLCGDCLYQRYGENVLEANQNPDWICPFCRGICNCSRCRRDKGWAPTGQIFGKVKSLGYKSVAQYLIQTRHERTIKEAESGESARSVISIVDGKEDSTDALGAPSFGGQKNETEDGCKKADMKEDSDEEYRGNEDCSEDDGDADSE